MIKMLKKYAIDEYGTAFAKDVYDPTKIGDDTTNNRNSLTQTIPNVIYIIIIKKSFTGI